MVPHSVEASLAGRLLVLGTGCICEGFLPLLWRHVDVQRSQVQLLSPDAQGQALAARHGLRWHCNALSSIGVSEELARWVHTGDVVLNLALGVDSLQVLDWCQRHGVLYLDSNLESWPGRARSLCEARSRALASRRGGDCTAVIAHGANPGLVTHFVKQALSALAPTQGDWAAAAAQLGVRAIQVSEYDSQAGGEALAAHEFVNTWSARGLAGELLAPVEIGWGSHESGYPTDAQLRHTTRGTAVQLAELGRETVVRTWAPSSGCFDAFVLAHHESLSISDLLTTSSGERPTVMYAVRPCPAARAASANLTKLVPRHGRVLKAEVHGGGNELGVLLLGDQLTHWYGSRLSLARARAIAPDNNATSLQVAAGVLGALVWVLENPRRGVVEAEDMDHRRVLAVAAPYLGELGGVSTPWRPDRGLRFTDFRVPSQPARFERATN